MKPELYKISDKAYIKNIYKKHMKADFPPDELKPLTFILKGMENGSYECYGLFDMDTVIKTGAVSAADGEPFCYELLGYAVFVKQTENIYLLDYFAVAEKHRNEGVGSLFLNKISKGIKNAECIVCEVEDPDKASDEKSREIQTKRLNFYLRNGYIKTEITAWLYGVNYRILEAPTGKKHTAEEIRKIYTALYRDMLPPLLLKKFFRVNL